MAAIAALAAAGLWAVKALVIWNAGGLDKSALESPLFLLGLVATVIAYAALGLVASGGRSVILRVVAVVVAVAAGVVVAGLSALLAAAVLPSSAGWVEEEAGLWIAAAVTVAVSLWLLRAREHPVAA